MPEYATPPGFLTLLTFSSFRTLPALFHTGNAPGIVLFEGFPFHDPAQSLDQPCLLDVGSNGSVTLERRFLARLPGFVLRESPLPRLAETSGDPILP